MYEASKKTDIFSHHEIAEQTLIKFLLDLSSFKLELTMLMK